VAANRSGGTTGRTGGPKNPSMKLDSMGGSSGGAGSKTPMARPTSMKRASSFHKGRSMKHNVSKGMPSLKHARLSKPIGRTVSWGNSQKRSATLWTAKVKK